MSAAFAGVVVYCNAATGDYYYIEATAANGALAATAVVAFGNATLVVCNDHHSTAIHSRRQSVVAAYK